MKKYKGKRQKEKQKKDGPTFSQFLVLFIIFLTVAWSGASIYLSYHGRDPVTEITTTTIQYCVGAIVAYYLKRGGEKCLRYIKKLDEDGHPYGVEKGGQEHG